MDDVEQDWGRDPHDRWVRLMADILSSGVWHRDGVGDAVEALPISRALGERIYRWQDWYDREDQSHEAGTAWEMTADWGIEAFAEEGLAIARALKLELPDWTVIYFDLAALKRHGGYWTNAARELWQNEIGPVS